MNKRLQYGFIVALILYWPMIFLFAHLPQVPGWILRTQMSDKTLHYIGYLVLVFLWWFSIFPARRPSLFSKSLWLTVAMMLVYAAADEWLQRFTHRTPDIMDVAADMAGVLTGLVIFAAAAGLQLSAIIVTAVVIFILTSLTKADPLGFVPYVDVVFYACAYGLVTLLWMRYLKSKMKSQISNLLVPVILLLIASAVASFRGTPVDTDRLIAAVAGIILPIAVTAFAAAFCKTKTPQRQ